MPGTSEVPRPSVGKVFQATRSPPRAENSEFLIRFRVRSSRVSELRICATGRWRDLLPSRSPRLPGLGDRMT